MIPDPDAALAVSSPSDVQPAPIQESVAFDPRPAPISDAHPIDRHIK